jgi:hypothetical protein
LEILQGIILPCTVADLIRIPLIVSMAFAFFVALRSVEQHYFLGIVSTVADIPALGFAKRHRFLDVSQVEWGFVRDSEHSSGRNSTACRRQSLPLVNSPGSALFPVHSPLSRFNAPLFPHSVPRTILD